MPKKKKIFFFVVMLSFALLSVMGGKSYSQSLPIVGEERIAEFITWNLL